MFNLLYLVTNRLFRVSASRLSTAAGAAEADSAVRLWYVLKMFSNLYQRVCLNLKQLLV